MKILLVLLTLLAILLAADKPKRKAKAPNPEEYWACGLGTQRERNGDHCLCPAMVSEIREEQIVACAEKHGERAQTTRLMSSAWGKSLTNATSFKTPT